MAAYCRAELQGALHDSPSSLPQGALHDSPPKRMALLLWSISRLSPVPSSPDPFAPATTSAPVPTSTLSASSTTAGVDAVLAMTLSPARLQPYLRMSGPPVLAQVLSNVFWGEGSKGDWMGGIG